MEEGFPAATCTILRSRKEKRMEKRVERATDVCEMLQNKRFVEANRLVRGAPQVQQPGE